MSSPSLTATASSISRKDNSIPPGSASSSTTPIPISTYTSTSSSQPPLPPVIFAHGASGSMYTPSVRYFSTGLAHFRPVVTFQGNTNMIARTNSFAAVAKWCSTQKEFGFSEQWIENLKHVILGGRSMGARAAILTANNFLEDVSLAPEVPEVFPPATQVTQVFASFRFILVSYPLVNTKGDERDQILLALTSATSVLFIIGTHDTMCPLDRLEEVRKSMEATSWLVRVEGANHGMETKPKKMMEKVVEETGRVTALWLNGEGVDRDKREARIWIEEDAEEKELVVKWSGWVEELEEVEETKKVDGVKPLKKKAKKSSAKKGSDPMEGEPDKSETKEEGQTPIKKKAANEPATEKPRTRKRKSANSQQDDSSTSGKKKRTKTTNTTTPSRASAQADPTSIASRTRSRKSAA